MVNRDSYSQIKVLVIDVAQLSDEIQSQYHKLLEENSLKATELKIGRNETFYIPLKISIVLETNIIIDDKGNIINVEDGIISLPVMSITNEINALGQNLESKTITPRFYEKISKLKLIGKYGLDYMSLPDFMDDNVFEDKRKINKLIGFIFTA